MIDVLWQYIMIFLMAATPWFEILLVIPIGVGMGLEPFLVALVSFAGNFLPILLIVWLLNWFQTTAYYARYKKRREEKMTTKDTPSRGQRVFQKYGLPGLAILGPLVTGIHLATVMALSLKVGKLSTTVWMGASLFIWTVGLTFASVYALETVVRLFG
ncbi:small multi-drug export protein [Salisediminibacterium beveridgei]|uniref:Small multi-drug export protein n=1 Tax=Salisediminibacterium beveridgei TaxID=632773 RepID=A0A1D7QXG7_9BACI|nr:small multi-drug export protein [Salisediminibacterium beveridgei]AOM83699.1 hypothetical protein BBEV_2358 [Salisediminibacterium beveridgei]